MNADARAPGHGVHFCLGAPLARLEGRVALQELTARFRELAVDHEAVTAGGGLRGHPKGILGTRWLPVRAVRARLAGSATMRSRWLIGTVVISVLLTTASILLWREVSGLRTPAVTKEVCRTDPTLSGLQGYCVQRRHRPAGPFVDEGTWLYVVAVQDGQQITRLTYAPYPFVDVDGEFAVRFDEGSITVSDAAGITVTYPESYYRLN